MGQTICSFVTRFKERGASYQLNKQTLNFVNYFNETGHTFPKSTNTNLCISIKRAESSRSYGGS